MASSASPTFSESVGCDDRERRGSLGELLRTFVTSLFVIAPFTDVTFSESELTAFESVRHPFPDDLHATLLPSLRLHWTGMPTFAPRESDEITSTSGPSGT
jgi:hypothetical protein